MYQYSCITPNGHIYGPEVGPSRFSTVGNGRYLTGTEHQGCNNAYVENETGPTNDGYCSTVPLISDNSSASEGQEPNSVNGLIKTTARSANEESLKSLNVKVKTANQEVDVMAVRN